MALKKPLQLRSGQCYSCFPKWSRLKNRACMPHAKPGNPRNSQANKKSSYFYKIDFCIHNRGFINTPIVEQAHFISSNFGLSTSFDR